MPPSVSLCNSLLWPEKMWKIGCGTDLIYSTPFLSALMSINPFCRWARTIIMRSIASCSREYLLCPHFARSHAIIPSRWWASAVPLWNNYHLLFTCDWAVGVDCHLVITSAVLQLCMYMRLPPYHVAMPRQVKVRPAGGGVEREKEFYFKNQQTPRRLLIGQVCFSLSTWKINELPRGNGSATNHMMGLGSCLSSPHQLTYFLPSHASIGYWEFAARVRQEMLTRSFEQLDEKKKRTWSLLITFGSQPSDVWLSMGANDYCCGRNFRY